MQLIRRLAEEGERIFTAARARELAPEAGLTDGYVRQALHRLVQGGWLVRLRKGLYALSASLTGLSPTHEFEIAMALVRPAAISHWTALHYHHLTEQAPRQVFVLTTTNASPPRVRRANPSRGYPVGHTFYQFVQVKPERFFGIQQVWIHDARVTITDPERTLLDGLSRPRYVGDFAEILHAFAMRGEALNLERIIAYALTWDVALSKRLGWVLEHRGVERERLAPLARVEVKGYRPLDPTGPRRGSCNRYWMIQENLPGKITP